MKIREINAMRGPNYWSIRREKLIVMVLDLETMEDYPTNEVSGFGERLKKMFPGMYEHRCSEGCEGGFFMRVDEGTWMGHCLLYTSDAADDLTRVDLGGRRIIKKKKR